MPWTDLAALLVGCAMIPLHQFATRYPDRLIIIMVTEVKELGRFVVTDPRICHGQLTFRGRRILVADVLDDVAHGMPWQGIVNDCWGRVRLDAIS